ncbi:MAG: SGNH/GDSL hydrolase family protein [Clostridiales bacterium]
MKKKYFLTLTIIFLISFILVLAIGHINNISGLSKESDLLDNKTKLNDSILYNKLTENNQINILVIGDNIGKSYGSSSKKNQWVNKFSQYLTKTYKANVKTKYITSLNSTAFSSLVDYSIENTPTKTDLAIICLGSNDINQYSAEQFSIFYENLIRKIKLENPNSEIITVLENSLEYSSKDSAKISQYVNIIKNLSMHYKTILLDAITVFNSSDIDPKELLTQNSIFPNDLGYLQYYNTIIDLFKNRLQELKTNKLILNTYNPDSQSFFSKKNTYNDFKLIKEPVFKKGFDEIQTKALSKIHIDEVPGNYIEFDINKSNLVSISCISNNKAGIINIYINNQLLKEIDLYSPLESKNHILITDNIQTTKTKIKIEISKDKNPASEGTKINILGLINISNK